MGDTLRTDGARVWSVGGTAVQLGEALAGGGREGGVAVGVEDPLEVGSGSGGVAGAEEVLGEVEPHAASAARLLLVERGAGGSDLLGARGVGEPGQVLAVEVDGLVVFACLLRGDGLGLEGVGLGVGPGPLEGLADRVVGGECVEALLGAVGEWRALVGRGELEEGRCGVGVAAGVDRASGLGEERVGPLAERLGGFGRGDAGGVGVGKLGELAIDGVGLAEAAGLLGPAGRGQARGRVGQVGDAQEPVAEGLPLVVEAVEECGAQAADARASGPAARRGVVGAFVRLLVLFPRDMLGPAFMPG